MAEGYPLTVMLRNLEAHAALDETDRAAVLALPYTLRRVSPSGYVVREAEIPGTCGVLISGFAFRSKVTSEGARQIVSLQIPGDLLDLQHLFLDRADHNVQALGEALLALVARPALHALAELRPNVGHAFAINNAVEASISREWIVNIGRRSARKRLAHLFCELAARLRQRKIIEDYAFELPMTQDQLGDALGLTSVHVNRTLLWLEAEGVVARDKRRIIVPDWDRMRDFAGFSESYLHAGQQGAALSPIPNWQTGATSPWRGGSSEPA